MGLIRENRITVETGVKSTVKLVNKMLEENYNEQHGMFRG